MKERLLPLIIVLLVAANSPAQQITHVANPEASGFSAERLKRIDANLNDWVTKGWMNGAVGLIVRNRKIVYYKSADIMTWIQNLQCQKTTFLELLRKQKQLQVWL